MPCTTCRLRVSGAGVPDTVVVEGARPNDEVPAEKSRRTLASPGGDRAKKTWIRRPHGLLVTKRLTATDSRVALGRTSEPEGLVPVARCPAAHRRPPATAKGPYGPPFCP